MRYSDDAEATGNDDANLDDIRFYVTKLMLLGVDTARFDEISSALQLEVKCSPILHYLISYRLIFRFLHFMFGQMDQAGMSPTARDESVDSGNIQLEMTDIHDMIPDVLEEGNRQETTGRRV